MRDLGQHHEAIRAAIARRDQALNWPKRGPLGWGREQTKRRQRAERLGIYSPDLDRLLGAFGGASLVYSNMMLKSWNLRRAQAWRFSRLPKLCFFQKMWYMDEVALHLHHARREGRRRAVRVCGPRLLGLEEERRQAFTMSGRVPQ